MYKKSLALSLALISTGALADNQFSGSYVGLSLGYVYGQDSDKESWSGVPNGWTTNTSPNGALLGLAAGFNQVLENHILLGVEGDYEFRDAEDKTLFESNGVPDSRYPMTTELQSALSIRGRVGYLFNNDKTLAYFTGGFASVEIKRTYYDTAATTNSQSITKRQYGWTTGLGVEHFVTEKLSLQAEYRYADYEDVELNSNIVYGSGTTEKQQYDEQSLRVGMMYHF